MIDECQLLCQTYVNITVVFSLSSYLHAYIYIYSPNQKFKTT